MDTIKLILAIIVAIAVYGGLHYYLYRKVKSVLPAQQRGIISTLSILASLLFVVEALIHNEVTLFIIPLAWVTFYWMGLVVLFFGVSIPFDLLAWLARLGRVTTIAQLLSSPLRTMVVGLFVFVLSVSATFTAKQVNIEQVILESQKLTRPIRIVQIADLHADAFSSEQRIRRIVEKINELDADIIVSTGDLIDMSTDSADAGFSQLSELQATLGKYAVFGNHETFVGLDKSRRLTESVGFTLLSNNGITLDGMINIFGVDDPSVAGRMPLSTSNPHDPMPAFSNSLFTVLLKHQPVVATDSTTSFDLQLSGHVHGGQIYPFGLITAVVYRVPMGLSRIADETWLYVSRGAGTWGPPMRVLAPPEITLFHLQPITDS